MQLKSILKKDDGLGLPSNDLVLEARIYGGVTLRTKVTVLTLLDVEFVNDRGVHINLHGLYAEQASQLARFLSTAELLRMVYRQNFESKYVNATPAQAVAMVVVAARSETYQKLGIDVQVDDLEYNGDGEEYEAEFDSRTGGI